MVGAHGDPGRLGSQAWRPRKGTSSEPLQSIPTTRHRRSQTRIRQPKLSERVFVFSVVAECTTDHKVVLRRWAAMTMRRDMVVLEPEALKSSMLLARISPIPV